MKVNVPISTPFLIALDAISLGVSFYIGLYFSWVDFDYQSSNIITYFPKVGIFIIVMILMFYSVGIYHSRYFRNFGDSLIRFSTAIFLGILIMSSIFYLFPSVIIWRSIMLPTLMSVFFFFGFSRFMAFRVLHVDLIKRRILIMGAGEKAARIEAIENDGRAYGFHCVGYYNFSNDYPEIVSKAKLISTNAPLMDIVSAYSADEIVIAVEDRREKLPLEELMDLRMSGIKVWDFSSFVERETGAADLVTLTSGWFIFSSDFSDGPMHNAIKRLVDIAISLLLFAFVVPLVLCTAIAIRIDSSGPILLRQNRVGYMGKAFVLYKFRSMRSDAEQDGIPKWAAENDRRLTTVGAIIRRFRIDEIPQIWNVLRGDMSFVGPRPERLYFVEQLAQEIPFYNERHRVKPGITGWAQLNYSYGATHQDAWEKSKFDLYYVKYNNFFLDFAIIVQTIRVILWPDGVR